MKTINLEEIFDSYLEVDCDYSYTRESILVAMKEVCRQTLELAAENASYIHEFDGAHGCECKVDKQSILDTINQIK